MKPCFLALAATAATSSAFLAPSVRPHGATTSSLRRSRSAIASSPVDETLNEVLGGGPSLENPSSPPPKPTPIQLTGPQYLKTLPGSSAPFTFFDPLSIASKFRAIDVKKFRESEVKHARVAMLAIVGMLVQEVAHPLFDNGGKDLGPAIYHMQAVQNYFALTPLALLVLVGIFEGNNIYVGWVKQPVTEGVADLKEDYEPGNFGFDPLGLMPKDDAGRKARMTQELNNGRLAMLATIGVWVQELIDGKTVLGHFFG